MNNPRVITHAESVADLAAEWPEQRPVSEFPPLPAGTRIVEDDLGELAYSKWDMYAYAEQCCADDVSERDALAGRVAELEAALSFYADPERYHGANQRVSGEPDPFTPEGQPYMQDVTRDRGDIARAALTTPESKP